jgi:hypothetical protein
MFARGIPVAAFEVTDIAERLRAIDRSRGVAFTGNR